MVEVLVAKGIEDSFGTEKEGTKSFCNVFENLFAKIFKKGGVDKVTEEPHNESSRSDATAGSAFFEDEDEERGGTPRRMSSILEEDCEKFHKSELKKFHELYDMHEELGKGTFGVVKMGELKSNPSEKFAIKVLTKSEMEEFDKGALHYEISILRQLEHKNIIQLYKVFSEPDEFYLVTELVCGGELFHRLVEKDSYSEKEAHDCGCVLVTAIQYMHSKQIAHRDLKAENLLLTSKEDDSSIKIADFGFAKHAPTPTSLKTQCGSPAEIAPEILGRKHYGVKCDMWSVGVILYSLIGGYPPFYAEDGDQDELFRKISAGDWEFHEDWWGHVSQEAKDMIASVLVVDPVRRASADDVMKSKWMNKSSLTHQQSSLKLNQTRLRDTVARRKMKAAITAVISSNKFNELKYLDFDEDE